MRKIVGFLLMFAIVLAWAPMLAIAAPGDTIVTGEAFSGQTEGNRYLSAELSKNMAQQKEDIIKAVNSNNDDNFREFDARINTYLNNVKMKITLAAAGASLIATAIAALFMMRQFKHYSYETYQAKIINKQINEKAAEGNDQKGLEQLQQPVWNPQQPGDTLSMHVGQTQAAQMTQMNAWQAQAAYGGGWQSPLETQQEYNHVPGGHIYDDEHKAELYSTEDPMQSPGWDPRTGGY